MWLLAANQFLYNFFHIIKLWLCSSSIWSVSTHAISLVVSQLWTLSTKFVDWGLLKHVSKAVSDFIHLISMQPNFIQKEAWRTIWLQSTMLGYHFHPNLTYLTENWPLIKSPTNLKVINPILVVKKIKCTKIVQWHCNADNLFKHYIINPLHYTIFNYVSIFTIYCSVYVFSCTISEYYPSVCQCNVPWSLLNGLMSSLVRHTATAQQDAFLKRCTLFNCVAENVTVTSDLAFTPPILPLNLANNSTN